VRKTKEKRKVIDPGLKDDQSKGITLYYAIQQRFLAAEVERQNLTPTDAEVEAYIKPNKAGCMAPDNLECQRYIREQGYANPEDFWTAAKENYKADLGEARLVKDA
jgi:hypothetical protein